MSAPVTRVEPELAWSLLGAVGLAFTGVATTDLVLAWIPPRLGDGGWVFDTVAATLGGMPLLVVGVALAFGAAQARRRYIGLRVVSGAMIALALMTAAVFVLYLLRVPSALGSAESPAHRVELLKMVIRTGAQGVLYPVALLWLGIKGWIDASRF